MQNDPEDEAFEELSKALALRKHRASALPAPEAAFREWSGHSPSPQERSAFMAGWHAAMEHGR